MNVTPQKFECGEALTISHAAEISQRLKSTIETSLNIALVADKVEKVDTSGLQVLISFKKEIEKVGGNLIWDSVSETVYTAADFLGVKEQLSLNGSEKS